MARAIKKKKRKRSIPRKDYGLKNRGDRIVVPMADVFPNPWNPNEQTEEMRGKTRRSLDRFGNVSEVLVRQVGPALPEHRGRYEREGYQIVDGEHRWVELVDAGEKELEVRNLGEMSDYEAMQITGTIDELSGAPEPLKLADLVADLDAGGHRPAMEEVFPFSKDEIDGLVKLRDADKPFLDTAQTRLKRKIRNKGVAFKVGKHKAKLPEDLGKRLILAYEAVGAQVHTNDAVGVVTRIVDIIESQLEEGAPDDGEEEEAVEAEG